ncbi:MAG: hypothetical protein LBQ76_09485 [Candidatus Fibromonas sp.]|jgi:hypothetical protein|nr:hypothetical protein [Candidatus Fibromonas sp.]
MNTEEELLKRLGMNPTTEKNNFRHIVKICAFALCVLFFACPLAKCSKDDSLTASGWEIATGKGELFNAANKVSKNKDDGYPLVFALIIIPAVLLVFAFTNKSFIVLRNVSIAGLVVKIIFLIAAHIKLSGYYEGAFKLTGNNWFILLIYAGLAGFTLHCAKHEEGGDILEKLLSSSKDTQEASNLLNLSSSENTLGKSDPLNLLSSKNNRGKSDDPLNLL